MKSFGAISVTEQSWDTLISKVKSPVISAANQIVSDCFNSQSTAAAINWQQQVGFSVRIVHIYMFSVSQYYPNSLCSTNATIGIFLTRSSSLRPGTKGFTCGK